MKKIILLALLLLTFSAFCSDQEVYSIGILAKRGVTAGFYEKWLLHAAYLEEKTGRRFEIIPLEFVEVEPAVAEGKVDFLLVNSSMFTRNKVKHGIEELATMINKSALGSSASLFGGVIFTSQASSGVQSLADVKGKAFIAVKDSSFGGYQMALKEYKDNGIDLTAAASNIEFAGSHDNVVRQVLARPGTIGTVRTDTLERMAFEGKIKIEDIQIINGKEYQDFPFLISTALYPEWPIARLQKTDNALARQVVDALIQMQETETAAIKARISGWTRPADYKGVEVLLKTLGLI